MKKYQVFIMTLLFITSLVACSNGQTNRTNTNLSAVEFSNAINKNTQAPVIDVRTPDEFSKGHIKGALNYNWNSGDFASQIAKLDKTKAVYVYCLSGGRSSSAAAMMRSNGFKEVYEMSGGMMKWRASNLPETTDNTPKSAGMSTSQFNELLNTDKLVLVDFYADWCAPCKKMKPYLEEISNEMSDKVTVIRINADDHMALCKEMKIDELPVLLLYKNKEQIWKNNGYIDKEGVLTHLN